MKIAEAAKKYKGWPLIEELPEGWSVNKHIGSPLHNHFFVTNGKSFFSADRRVALLRVEKKPLTESKTITKQIPAIVETQPNAAKSKATGYTFDKESARAVNILARQRFKQKLLADILIDLTICEIEGWSKREYINELKNLINSIGKARRVDINQMVLDIAEAA